MQNSEWSKRILRTAMAVAVAAGSMAAWGEEGNYRLSEDSKEKTRKEALDKSPAAASESSHVQPSAATRSGRSGSPTGEPPVNLKTSGDYLDPLARPSRTASEK